MICHSVIVYIFNIIIIVKLLWRERNKTLQGGLIGKIISFLCGNNSKSTSSHDPDDDYCLF